MNTSMSSDYIPWFLPNSWRFTSIIIHEGQSTEAREERQKMLTLKRLMEATLTPTKWWMDWFTHTHLKHYSPSHLVSCPDPLARAKRVWCFEQHFLSHGTGPISDLRSPSWLQKAELQLHDVSDRILKWIRYNENVSQSMFSAVPIDFAAVLSFYKPG